MNIYVMRHGTTVWNEKGICQGRSQNRLSKNGKKFAEQAALSLKDVDLDVIITSPLMRTVQTANIMNKFHNVKIVKDNDIIEIDQGIFAGRAKKNLTPEESNLLLTRSKAAKMETYEECFNRNKKFVEKLIATKNYNNVLIVTHRTGTTFISRILSHEVIDLTTPQFFNDFKNAEIKKFVV